MISLHNIDCMEYMATLPDKAFDLAIVDPPYGLGDKLTNGGTWAAKYSNSDSYWDVVPTQDYFMQIQRVSNNQIICGGNYFNLPPTRCFLIWDKGHFPTMADCEFIWTSFDSNAKIFRYPRTQQHRIHPTQKPVALYKWLLKHYAKQGDRILDTHLGSGSIAIACHDMGFDLVGCELDTDYYNAACKRLSDHQKQLTLL